MTAAPVPFVDLAAQQASIAVELEEVVRRMLGRTDWILGEELTLFEQEFAAYCEVGHAVGTDSGLSALELILRVLGIGPGDEVIIPANTFVATALAISHAGATPVLVDADPRTDNIDPELIEAALSERTKAIMPVHLYGRVADMDSIRRVADKHRLVVIEDACQAHGARYNGRRAGGLGQAAAFSFYPAKNLGAFGDGGALVTDDADLAEQARMLRDYGQRRKYDHAVKGFNRRLDTLQAAFLRVKLPHLDAWNAARRSHAAQYARMLAPARIDTPAAPPEEEEHVWHLYVIRSDERDALRAALQEVGVSTGVHYPLPVHLQTAYADLGHGRGSFPVSERAAAEVLSLPMYPELTAELIERVPAEIQRFGSGGAAMRTVAS